MKGEIFRNKTVSGYINLLNAILCGIITVAYSISASSANNYNKNVTIYMVVALVCCGIYFLVPHVAADIANLVSVIFITLAIGTFAINSINTFADVLNGISMFGSTGGIGYIITLLAMMGVVLILEIVSCFMRREKMDNITME